MRQGRLKRTHPSAGDSVNYRIEARENRLLLELDDQSLELEIYQENSNSGWCRWQGRIWPFAYERDGDEVHIWLDGTSFTFVSVGRRSSSLDRIPNGTAPSLRDAPFASAVDSGAVTSKISGMVLVLNVSPGDIVSAGDEVCVIEAMKMEHSIRSNFGGVVREVLVQENQQVSAGDVLVSFEQESATTG